MIIIINCFKNVPSNRSSRFGGSTIANPEKLCNCPGDKGFVHELSVIEVKKKKS